MHGSLISANFPKRLGKPCSTNFEIFFHFPMFCSTFISLCFLAFFAAIHGKCMNNKDKGRICDKPQSTRWYFNEKKFRCMAFTYLGCGGNDNNFVNMNDCHTQCMPADGPVCLSSEFALPAPMPADAAKYGSHWCQKTGCPAGFQCHNGIQFSQCCNETAENWFTEGNDPKCKNGQNVYQLGGHLALGDTCADLVCPQGYTCESTNSLFAKCCP